MKKMSLVILSTTLAVSIGLAACSGNETASVKKASTNTPKQILNVTENAEIPSMDSTLATDAVSFRVMNNVLEGLYRLDQNNKPQPAIAKSVNISEDKKTYTFKLRETKWSNGDPLTAHDFVYAWKRAVDPSVAAEYAYILFDVKNAEEVNNKKLPVDQLGVKALDDYTFQVELKNPVPYFLDVITSPMFYPLNQKFVTQQGQRHGTFENQMMGAIMDAWVRELYKHSDYYKKAEPTIIINDLSGFEIAKNDKPVKFDEDAKTSKDLGTFKIGDKVDVGGHIITLSNAVYDDSKKEEYEVTAAKVLKVDFVYQNSTKEEQFIDGHQFEIYDADGTKQEVTSIDFFGENVQPGKNVSGSVHFGVTGKGPYEIFFADMATDTKAKWIIDIK
jgi:oligopeptide transport system substrate-binding protein